MLKVGCCKSEFVYHLYNLIHVMWSGKEVLRDWFYAVLVPIPRNRDLSLCDNWWGIAPLDVDGKILAKILWKRLQKMWEEELPEPVWLLGKERVFRHDIHSLSGKSWRSHMASSQGLLVCWLEKGIRLGPPCCLVKNPSEARHQLKCCHANLVFSWVHEGPDTCEWEGIRRDICC